MAFARAERRIYGFKINLRDCFMAFSLRRKARRQTLPGDLHKGSGREGCGLHNTKQDAGNAARKRALQWQA